MDQGRFDFGSFLTWQGDQSASKGEITTPVVEGVSQTHDEVSLRAKLDKSRGCACNSGSGPKSLAHTKEPLVSFCVVEVAHTSVITVSVNKNRRRVSKI